MKSRNQVAIFQLDELVALSLTNLLDRYNEKYSKGITYKIVGRFEEIVEEIRSGATLVLLDNNSGLKILEKLALLGSTNPTYRVAILVPELSENDPLYTQAHDLGGEAYELPTNIQEMWVILD